LPALNGSVIANWRSEPLVFHVSTPVIEEPFTVDWYCVIRPVFAS
jgi:hypothetical protein